MNMLARAHVVLFDPRESRGRADSDFCWFWLGRKTANFTADVNWSTTSITQERLLKVVNKTAFIHYTLIKNHVQQPNGFQFEVRRDKLTGNNS